MLSRLSRVDLISTLTSFSSYRILDVSKLPICNLNSPIDIINNISNGNVCIQSKLQFYIVLSRIFSKSSAAELHDQQRSNIR